MASILLGFGNSHWRASALFFSSRPGTCNRGSNSFGCKQLVRDDARCTIFFFLRHTSLTYVWLFLIGQASTCYTAHRAKIWMDCHCGGSIHSESCTWYIICMLGLLCFHKHGGFWGSQFFDLTGLACGHYLVPFSIFFGATIFGKAVIKVGGLVWMVKTRTNP